MKKKNFKREIGLSLILTILTFGIYGIFWFIDLVDDINELNQDKHATSGGVTFFWIFISCGLYGLYWSYNTSKEVDNILNKKGIKSNNSALLSLLLALFCLNIVNVALFQNRINKIK